MKRYFVLISLIVCCLHSEPSAFDAGRLDSKRPYGLTQSEEYLLATNNQLQDVARDVARLKTQVNRILEQQEGATSVLEGVNLRITSLNRAIQSSDGNDSITIEKLQSEIAALQTYVKESRDIEAANQESVKNILTELTSVIDKTNNNYAVLGDRIAALEKKNSSTPAMESNSAFKDITSENLLKTGEQLFNEKKYSDAELYFQELIVRYYKPARSSFMLGEIAYFNQNWNNAIVLYKKSSELYDKADYMPKLLYHTAISFDKIQDTANANQFYNLLKTAYPDSAEAKASPNR